jgi:hypothetical protein
MIFSRCGCESTNDFMLLMPPRLRHILSELCAHGTNQSKSGLFEVRGLKAFSPRPPSVL